MTVERGICRRGAGHDHIASRFLAGARRETIEPGPGNGAIATVGKRS